MDTSEVSEVLELFEVFEMLIEAVNSINQESECHEVSVEGNQTASQPCELVDAQHDQPQSQLHVQAGAISKSASRFKVLDDQQLLEIEQNQYSASTKKNTKWGVCVFIGTCRCLMVLYPKVQVVSKFWMINSSWKLSRTSTVHQLRKTPNGAFAYSLVRVDA